jgi:hypothetical protein
MDMGTQGDIPVGIRTITEAVQARKELEKIINLKIRAYEEAFGVKIDGIWFDRLNDVEFDELEHVTPARLGVRLSVTL